MKEVMIVVGTRPEAIKLAPVIAALQMSATLRPVVCSTGQHKEMLDQVFEDFSIRPDVELNLMTSGQTLSGLTSLLMREISSTLERFHPAVVVVHGDTTTAAITSMASFYQNIACVHVEAGLRTGDLYSPFPEEFNRRLIAMTASFHFAPTDQSVSNLVKEGIDENQILKTGNTVIDALLLTLQKIENDESLRGALKARLRDLIGRDIQGQPFILITGHRRENFGEGFSQICRALQILAERNPDVLFVYPVHLNPSVRQPVFKLLSSQPNIRLIEPQDYTTFCYLMSECLLILTDSGGIQEEAPSLSKPVLVMRNTTERPEAVHSGAVMLVGTSVEQIVGETSKLLHSPEAYRKMADSQSPFGDGAAGIRIAAQLETIYGI